MSIPFVKLFIIILSVYKEVDTMYPRIRNLREDKDMTQTQIAKALNMSQTGYSKYETGENDVPTSILIKLAEFHKTNVDYILGLTNVSKYYKLL